MGGLCEQVRKGGGEWVGGLCEQVRCVVESG